MAIKQEYLEYLEHFEKTKTLYAYSKSDQHGIALRHDVDYCLDTALEMAFWEHEKGIQSSYYLLHTADYRHDPLYCDKCYQIQEFGHEIGIHTNFISQWIKEGENPLQNLKSELEALRSSGIRVFGTAAHGDAECYKKGFINYWLFQELRPDQPEKREATLNAEGIFEKDLNKRIPYPLDHTLRRPNGDELALWRISQKDFELEYEASHLYNDMYFTDSGGGWKRSPDPLTSKLKKQRIQVLIHPIYWRAPRRVYFFLSTARSGSKWLSTVLNNASSCQAKHEYTLNNYSTNDGQHYAEKLTGDKLLNLLGRNDKIVDALDHTRNMVNDSSFDYAEVNVYLPLVLDQLMESFPDAQLIHLHRRPADVVRSIMNRGWYDTPFDTSHPNNLVDNWDQLSPFEKCCIYVKQINTSLLNKTRYSIKFERMVSDPKYLKQVLFSLGIAYYPYLAKDIISKVINENKLSHFLKYPEWDLQHKKDYYTYCFDIATKLKYHNDKICNWSKIKTLIQGFYKWLTHKKNLTTGVTAFNLPSSTLFEKVFIKNCEKSYIKKKLTLKALDREAHAYALINGGQWNKIEKSSGWFFQVDGYYSVCFSGYCLNSAKVNLFCLYYDKEGKLFFKRSLGTIEKQLRKKNFSFAAMGNSGFFNLAIYMPKQDFDRVIVLENIEIKFTSY